MDAADLARTARAWRTRFATAQGDDDTSAAEAAIRRAYRASAVPQPEQILWVQGPREAVRTLLFLRSPPRTTRRIVGAMLVLGAAAWAGLALAIEHGALVGYSPPTAAAVSLGLAGLASVLAGAWRLPVPSAARGPRRDRRILVSGVALFLALAAHVFAVQRFGGLPSGPLERGAALLFAASVGTLPGLFLQLRARRAYAPLPRALRELRPSVSVAHRLERARRKVWAPFHYSPWGPRPDRSLLEGYQHAYRLALMRERPRLLAIDPWLHGPRGPRNGVDPVAAGTLWSLLSHLDGLEDAPRAAAVAAAGARGAAAAFAELAFRVDRLYPLASIAVAVRPATRLQLDAEGRPHSAAGPALVWADGTRVHAWHGRPVPAALVDRTRPVTRLRIESELDPVRRAVLIDRYGLGRYLLRAGATEIQRDACGRLYRLAQDFGEPIVAVRVVNGTPEPDGSRREFWLRVPPTVTTAREAVAWTFHLPTAAYRPVAQS